MNIEKFYQTLANVALVYFQDVAWDEIGLEIEIGDTFVSNAPWSKLNGEEIYPKSTLPMQVETDLSNAVKFIKKDILENSGNRIWGLTFILNSDNQFNIKYNYNKPEWLEN